MWTQYAHVRANTLPPLWKKFLLNIGCEECCSEPLLMELINESIMYCFLSKRLSLNLKPQEPQLGVSFWCIAYYA